MKGSVGPRKAQPSADTNRRQSTRQARSTAIRPTNYYARPFPSFGGQAEETTKDAAPGFFPAIQHFTDSVDALPKEVVRHFSMLKEVEAKVHGPDEILAQLHKTIFDLPPPLRRQPHPLTQNLSSLPATTSMNGSISGSVANGSVSSLPQQATETLENPGPPHAVDDEADMRRRHLFFELRQTLYNMMMILDEKNAVITTANHTLSKQLARMDSSFPSVEKEISEEARLGSLTHWAYQDKDSRKANGTTTTERRGRDVAAANNLAAAAAAVHEGDIAAHRSEQRRQAVAERRGRATVDSDFDDRPVKKSHHAKVRKTVDPVGDAKHGNHGIGGAASGTTTKRRKVEKGTTAATDRSIAVAFRGAGAGISPREASAAETSRKKTKAAPSASSGRRRVAAGGNQSPSVASSPLHSTFAAAATKEFSPASERPISSRARQGSTSKPLQATILAETSRNGSISSTSNKQANGVGPGTPELRSVADVTGRTVAEARSALKDAYENKNGEPTIEESNVRGALAINPDLHPHSTTTSSSLKREDAPAAPDTGPAAAAVDDLEPAVPAPVITRSGRQSKTATPITASFPSDIPMARSRSTRHNSLAQAAASNGHGNGAGAGSNGGGGGGGGGVASAAEAPAKRSHKRGASSVHQQQQQQHSLDTSRTTSKPSSPDPSRVVSRHSSRTVPDAEDAGAMAVRGRDLAGSEGEIEVDEEDEDEENEPRYCYCNGVSYGEMVACDNDACAKEWFHLTCVGLTKPPPSKSEFLSLLLLVFRLGMLWMMADYVASEMVL
ncbi:MAG: hypothetical protein Q9165_004697 [Trypethelium subeluteriae]